MKEIIDKYKNYTITEDTVFPLVVEVMKDVQKKKMNGSVKKQMVIKIISHLIIKSSIDSNTQELLLMVAPLVIELVMSIVKNKTSLRKLKKKCKCGII